MWDSEGKELITIYSDDYQGWLTSASRLSHSQRWLTVSQLSKENQENRHAYNSKTKKNVENWKHFKTLKNSMLLVW